MGGLIATSLTFYKASADEGKLQLGSDISTKGIIGKSDENMSMNANVSANSTMKSSEKSQAEDNENNQASSSMKTESHGNYKMSYEKMDADSDNSVTVESEHHLYKAGEEVTLKGSIWSYLMTSVAGINSVSIQVTDNNGNSVYSGKGQVNSTGDYLTEFQLPSDAKNGAYTINVKADVKASLLNNIALNTKTNLESSAKFVVVSPNAFAVKAQDKDFDVQIASNSTNVSEPKFDQEQKKLSFMVSGQTGTKGVTEITIPKSLLSGDLTVMIDGQVMAQSDVIETEDTSDNTSLEINYHHSTHQIDIVGTNAAPEFSSLVSIVLVFAIISVIVLSMKIRVFNISQH